MESSIQNRITLHNFVPKEKYSETIIQYDLFFGMAGALILAASSGVASLIAIQEEKKEISYGFICDYDHEINSIFGDRSKYAEEKNLEESILVFNRLNTRERMELSQKCVTATNAYSTASTKERLLAKIEKAGVIKNLDVSTTAIFKIFVEVKNSQRKGILVEHT
jgi:hypothetical protein